MDQNDLDNLTEGGWWVHHESEAIRFEPSAFAYGSMLSDLQIEAINNTQALQLINEGYTNDTYWCLKNEKRQELYELMGTIKKTLNLSEIQFTLEQLQGMVQNAGLDVKQCYPEMKNLENKLHRQLLDLNIVGKAVISQVNQYVNEVSTSVSQDNTTELVLP